MPGVVELLENLIAKKIPYALASSSDLEIIQIIMEKSGLKKYFRHMVSSSQVGKSKPAPDVFLHTANLLDVDSSKCVVIEDSRNGIAAAKAAGMYCIAYSGAHSGHQDQSMADRQISHFDELIDLETWLKSA